MSVGTDAAKEQVDAAVGLYLALVVGALFHKVGGVAVEDMDVLGLYVDIAEEVGPHEGVVALAVFFRQADVLVHIERHDVLKRHLAFLIQADELFVHAQGRGAGGTAQDKGVVGGGLLLVDFLYYVVGCPARYEGVVV